MSANTFDAKATLTVGDRSDEIFRLDALRVPYDMAPSALLAQDPGSRTCFATRMARRSTPRTSRRAESRSVAALSKGRLPGLPRNGKRPQPAGATARSRTGRTFGHRC